MDPTHIDPATRAPKHSDDTSFRPRAFRLGDPSDARALSELFDSGAVFQVHESYRTQIVELIETRNPSRKLTPEALETIVASRLRGTPLHQQGCWFFYPWSGRLVHVLDEREYRELRTSRNRNKITTEEQRRLGALRVGVVGLSVGQATAVTLALEGVGGEFRLADFDTLNLSNMNRLRAGAHEIGVNKAVLTAREIFEIDPYARITVFADGIGDHNLDAFFEDGGRLDLLFEECDDLKMKVLLREEARRRRVPVLMETSDRGLFDVERFDRDPDRPPFHGLTGPLEARSLEGMSTYQKVPIVLRIIGQETLSNRMAASLVDIDATLKTWPQLASAVALGGAINTDAARRIALGTFNESGRYFVDLERLVGDGASVPITPYRPPAAALRLEPELPPLVATVDDDRSEQPSPEVIRSLVAYAALAPSGGNCQPWHFHYREGRLHFIHEEQRSRTLLDFEHRASYLAFGAAAENLSIAAEQLGWACEFDLFPDADDATRVCTVRFHRAPADAPRRSTAVLEQITRRVTNRRAAKPVPLAREIAASLTEIAAAHGARLQLVTERSALDAIGRVLGHGERLRLLSRTMHTEMMNEIRWTPAEAKATRDGLDVASLELTATDLAGMQLISRWPVVAEIARVGGGHGLDQPSVKAVAAASAMGLLTLEGRGRERYFEGGRALQRVWLLANAQGLAFQPMSALVYLFARLEQGGGEGFDAREQADLTTLRQQFNALFGDPAGRTELMLFRLAHAAPPTARSLRRPLDEILSFAP